MQHFRAEYVFVRVILLPNEITLALWSNDDENCKIELIAASTIRHCCLTTSTGIAMCGTAAARSSWLPAVEVVEREQDSASADQAASSEAAIVAVVVLLARHQETHHSVPCVLRRGRCRPATGMTAGAAAATPRAAVPIAGPWNR